MLQTKKSEGTDAYSDGVKEKNYRKCKKKKRINPDFYKIVYIVFFVLEFLDTASNRDCPFFVC